MKKVNVSSSKSPGRTTQYMSENFADLANLANSKLLKSSSNPEKKYETLKEMCACLELFLEKSDTIPVSPKLRRIIQRVETLIEDLDEYIVSSKPK